MPYIKKNQRLELDVIIEDMGKCLSLSGDLNYLLFAYCLRHVAPSYNAYKNFIGELNECVAEIRRRILSKYENEKIRENGDVGE